MVADAPTPPRGSAGVRRHGVFCMIKSFGRRLRFTAGTAGVIAFLMVASAAAQSEVLDTIVSSSSATTAAPDSTTAPTAATTTTLPAEDATPPDPADQTDPADQNEQGQSGVQPGSGGDEQQGGDGGDGQGDGEDGQDDSSDRQSGVQPGGGGDEQSGGTGPADQNEQGQGGVQPGGGGDEQQGGDGGEGQGDNGGNEPGAGGQGQEEDEGEEESIPASIALSVDTDPEAEGAQTEVDEGRAALVTVFAAFPDGAQALEIDTVVTVSVGGQGGNGQAEVEDFNPVDDFDVTIHAGQTFGAADFTIEVIDDLVVEGDETVEVTGVAHASGITDITAATLTIIDNDSDEEETAPPPAPPPGDRLVSGNSGNQDPAVAVGLSVDSQSDAGNQDYVDEGDTRTVTVTAALPDGQAALSTAAAFTVTIAADTAENADFTAPASVDVTISAGQTSGSATFSFTAASDTVLEGPETVSLTSSLSGYTVSPAALTIRDEDAQFRLTAGSSSVDEDAGASPVVLTVSFPNAASSELGAETLVSVAATGDGAAAGTDFESIDDFTVAVAANAVSGSKSITITPTDDVIHEASTEKVKFTGTLFGRTAETAVTITDNDAAPTVIDLKVDTSAAAGEQTSLAENTGASVVIVAAEFASGTAVETDTALTLRMSSLNTSDFTLTIPKNRVRGTTLVGVTPVDNNLAGEAPKTVTVSLQGTSSYTVNQGEFTIEDDEEAVVYLRPISCRTSQGFDNLNEGDSNICVGITGSLPAGSVAVRPFTVSGLTFGGTADSGTDYTALFTVNNDQSVRNEIRFEANRQSASLSAMMIITVHDDSAADEGVETIVIGGSADGGFKVRPFAFRIRDNDHSANRINLMVDASTAGGFQTSVEEGAAAQTVAVTAAYANGASRSSAAAVTVSVAGAGGAYGAEAADFTAVDNFTVTIPAGASSGSASFSLTTVSDDLLEGDEDLAVSGTASGFTVNGAVVTIDDDETVPTVDLSVDAQPAGGDQTYVDEGSVRTATVRAAVAAWGGRARIGGDLHGFHRGRHGRGRRFHRPRLGGCNHPRQPAQRYGHFQLQRRRRHGPRRAGNGDPDLFIERLHGQPRRPYHPRPGLPVPVGAQQDLGGGG